MSEKFSVAVLIPVRMNDGQFKVVGVTRKDNPNDWGLPGGKIEPGETFIEAAVRETFEETGIKLAAFSLQRAYSGPIGEYNCTTYILYGSDLQENWTLAHLRPENGTGSLTGLVGLNELINGCFGDYNDRLFMELAWRQR